MSIKKESLANLIKTSALICFTAYLLLNSLLSGAQTLTVTGAYSIPLGNYGSKDATIMDSQYGLAKPGSALSIIFDLNKKHSWINPFIQYTYNANKMDEVAAASIAKRADPTFVEIQAIRPWRQNAILAGPRFNYYGSAYELFAKAGIGMGWLSTYSYNLYYDSLVLSYGKFYGLNAVLKNQGLKAFSLVYSVGVGSNININHSISLCLGYEFYYSSPDYGIEVLKDINNINIVQGSTANPKNISFKIPFLVSTFYCGLRFNLDQALTKK